MMMMKKPENLDFETWALILGQSSSVLSFKNTLFKRQLYRLVKNLKMFYLFRWQHGISFLLFWPFLLLIFLSSLGIRILKAAAAFELNNPNKPYRR
jgi:hypothetical protein